MNIVILIGRLTNDPKIFVVSGRKMAKFTLAVNRIIKGGEEATDFIDTVVFDKSAEVVEKYCGRGKQICVVGRIQTKTVKLEDGTSRKYYDVVGNKIELLASPKNGSGKAASIDAESGTDILPDEDFDLPDLSDLPDSPEDFEF